jgi:DNA-binding response OmpR family regulator
MRVLVIADDSALIELLVDALAQAGHQVLAAEAEEAILEAFALGRVDAAIVDLDDHRREGAAWARLVRRISPGSRLVALLPCGGAFPAGAAAPCDAALEKPARLGAVLAALDAGVGASR